MCRIRVARAGIVIENRVDIDSAIKDDLGLKKQVWGYRISNCKL